MTVTAVGCMTYTTAKVKRDFRGYEETSTPVELVPPRTSATQPALIPRFVQPARPKSLGRGPNRILPRQSSPQTKYNITALNGEAATLWTQCNTAIYALNLLTTPGVDPSQLCLELRVDQQVAGFAGPTDGVDTQQCADIVCWAAVYGYDFNTTTSQVIYELIESIYAIETGVTFPRSNNSTQMCNDINFSIEPYLGINASAVSSFICQPTATTASVGTGLWPNVGPTGGAEPYANSSNWDSTSAGQDASPMPTPAGAAAPKVPFSPPRQQYYGGRDQR